MAVIPDADGRVPEPDGLMYFSLAGAVERYGLSRDALMGLWRVTAGRWCHSVVEEVPEAGAKADVGLARGVGAGLELLRRVKYPWLGDDQWGYFLEVCRQKRLNPWARQLIAAVERDGVADEPADEDDADRAKGGELVLIMSIEAMRLLAHRTGLYAGMDEVEHEMGDMPGKPVSARATVYRLVGGTRASFSAKVYWEEFAPYRLEGTLWERMPRVCLERPAEAMALRRAFPAELGGVYVPEEGLMGNRPVKTGRRGMGMKVAAGREAETGDGEPRYEDDGEVPEVYDEEGGPQTARQCELALLDLGMRDMSRRRTVMRRFLDAYPHLAGKPELYRRVVKEVSDNPKAYGCEAAGPARGSYSGGF